MRVLYDTSVLLDVLLAREPFLADSSRALDAAASQDVDGLVAAHAVTTLFYLVHRGAGARRARPTLATLLQHLRVATVDDAVVRHALTSPLKDFEDAVTAHAAREAGAELIITRNGADFEGGPVVAVAPVAWRPV